MNNLKKWILEIRCRTEKQFMDPDLLLALEILDRTYDIADQELKNLMTECFELYRSDQNNNYWNCPYCRVKCYYGKSHICGDFKPTHGYLNGQEDRDRP